MCELTEKNKCIYSELHSEVFIQLEEAIENNIDIAIIRYLKQYFSKIENELFNCRITKFVKNECTNLASLAFSLFQNNYFSFLIHF